MTLGQRIQELRKQAGLSQEGLGESLGVSRQAVSKWESDGGIPELDTLIAMSRLFHITVGQLLGVEPPEEQESALETAPGFTEDQVEDILRRYAEQTRPVEDSLEEEPRSWLTQWGWLVTAATVVTAVIVVLFAQIGSLRSTVRLLRSEVSNLQVNVSNSMSNLSGTIRNSIYEILEEETELLSTFQCTLKNFDLEAETVTLSLSASLKEYKAGSTLQFILDCTKTDQTEVQVTSDFVVGPDFQATVTIPMNYHTEVSIRLADAEGNLQEQLVDYLYSFQAENLQLEAYNLRTVFAITITGFGFRSETARAEEAYIDIYTGYPKIFWPEEARLTAWVNGEEILSEALAITQSGDEPGLYLAGIEEIYHEVSLAEGDSFEVMLSVTDNLGREQEFLDGGTVNDGELQYMPMAASAIRVDG